MNFLKFVWQNFRVRHNAILMNFFFKTAFTLIKINHTYEYGTKLHISQRKKKSGEWTFEMYEEIAYYLKEVTNANYQ